MRAPRSPDVCANPSAPGTPMRAPGSPGARIESVDYRRSMIMPAPTVEFVDSSTRMNPPVSRLRE